LVLAVGAVAPALAASGSERCLALKVGAARRVATAYFKCLEDGALAGTSASPECLAAARERAVSLVARADAAGVCPGTLDETQPWGTCASPVSLDDGLDCALAKYDATGRLVGALFGCEGSVIRGRANAWVACRAAAQASFMTRVDTLVAEGCGSGVEFIARGIEGCFGNFRARPRCGNGNLDVGEVCDGLAPFCEGCRFRSNWTCCQLGPICGDGPVPPGDCC
jgi:hypothetical protein